MPKETMLIRAPKDVVQDMRTLFPKTRDAVIVRTMFNILKNTTRLTVRTQLRRIKRR